MKHHRRVAVVVAVVLIAGFLFVKAVAVHPACGCGPAPEWPTPLPATTETVVPPPLPPTPTKEVWLTGSAVTVTKGTVVVIDMQQVAGWHWVVREPLPAGLRLAPPKPYVPPTPGPPLAGGHEVEFRFLALEGTSLLGLDNFAPFGPRDVPYETRWVTITVR